MTTDGTNVLEDLKKAIEKLKKWIEEKKKEREARKAEKEAEKNAKNGIPMYEELRQALEETQSAIAYLSEIALDDERALKALNEVTDEIEGCLELSDEELEEGVKKACNRLQSISREYTTDRVYDYPDIVEAVDASFSEGSEIYADNNGRVYLAAPPDENGLRKVHTFVLDRSEEEVRIKGSVTMQADYFLSSLSPIPVNLEGIEKEQVTEVVGKKILDTLCASSNVLLAREKADLEEKIKAREGSVFKESFESEDEACKYRYNKETEIFQIFDKKNKSLISFRKKDKKITAMYADKGNEDFTSEDELVRVGQWHEKNGKISANITDTQDLYISNTIAGNKLALSFLAYNGIKQATKWKNKAWEMVEPESLDKVTSLAEAVQKKLGKEDAKLVAIGVRESDTAKSTFLRIDYPNQNERVYLTFTKDGEPDCIYARKIDKDGGKDGILRQITDDDQKPLGNYKRDADMVKMIKPYKEAINEVQGRPDIEKE